MPDDRVFIGGEEGKRMALESERTVKRWATMSQEQIEAELSADLLELTGIPANATAEDYRRASKERHQKFEAQLAEFRKSRGNDIDG